MIASFADNISTTPNPLLKFVPATTCWSHLLRVRRDVAPLVESLLRISQRSPFSTERCAALTALRELGECVPYRALFPVKSKVLRVLGDCLADRKRLVRREAARTRNTWFVLDVDPSK